MSAECCCFLNSIITAIYPWSPGLGINDLVSLTLRCDPVKAQPLVPSQCLTASGLFGLQMDHLGGECVCVYTTEQRCLVQITWEGRAGIRQGNIQSCDLETNDCWMQKKEKLEWSWTLTCREDQEDDMTTNRYTQELQTELSRVGLHLRNGADDQMGETWFRGDRLTCFLAGKSWAVFGS